MMFRGYAITARMIAIGVTLLLVVGLLLWGPAACRSYFTTKKQAEVTRGQAGAASASGAEAVNTVGNVMEESRKTDERVLSAQNNVRAAPEGKKGAAAIAQACRFKANRDKIQCKELAK